MSSEVPEPAGEKEEFRAGEEKGKGIYGRPSMQKRGDGAAK